MRAFKDSTGHQWQIKLTVGNLLAIKQNLKIDLLDSPEQMPTDIPTLMDVLWFICMDQAQALGIDCMTFGDRLDGDALAAGIDAFMEEWSDFFSRLAPAKKELLAGLWQSSKRGQEVQAERIKQAFGKLSIDWLESSESIQQGLQPGS